MQTSSQWETTLQCNVVSHWLGECKKWSLNIYYITIARLVGIKQTFLISSSTLNSPAYECKVLLYIAYWVAIFYVCYNLFLTTVAMTMTCPQTPLHIAGPPCWEVSGMVDYLHRGLVNVDLWCASKIPLTKWYIGTLNGAFGLVVIHKAFLRKLIPTPPHPTPHTHTPPHTPPNPHPHPTPHTTPWTKWPSFWQMVFSNAFS